MVGAAQIDALLQIDGAAERLVEGGIMRGDALHAGARIVVAIGAGLVRGAGLAVPQLLAVEHPQHAGIGGVVVLHRPGFRRHEAVAGAALAWRDFTRQARPPPAAPPARSMPAISFDGDRGGRGFRKTVVADPFEFELAALGRGGEEGDERVGGDRRKQVGAENLVAVIAAGKARDDVARDRLRRTRYGDSRFP